MTYGINANGIDPTLDYGAIVSERSIGAPKKKVITETVPHMDGFYDFSSMLGRVCYESRPVAYKLTVVADKPEDMASKASRIEAWAYGISNDELRDDLYPGWHFVASTQSVSTSFIGAHAASVTVNLLCQPFKLANDETEVELPIGETTIYNKGQRTLLTGSSDGACIVTVGNVSQSFAGENIELDLALNQGENTVTVAGSPCILKWREAVI